MPGSNGKPGIDANPTNNGEPSSRLHSNTKCARWILWRIQVCATRGASRDVAAYRFAEPGMNPRILFGHTRSPRAASAIGVLAAQVLVLFLIPSKSCRTNDLKTHWQITSWLDTPASAPCRERQRKIAKQWPTSSRMQKHLWFHLRTYGSQRASSQQKTIS